MIDILHLTTIHWNPWIHSLIPWECLQLLFVLHLFYLAWFIFSLIFTNSIWYFLLSIWFRSVNNLGRSYKSLCYRGRKKKLVYVFILLKYVKLALDRSRLRNFCSTFPQLYFRAFTEKTILWNWISSRATPFYYDHRLLVKCSIELSFIAFCVIFGAIKKPDTVCELINIVSIMFRVSRLTNNIDVFPFWKN